MSEIEKDPEEQLIDLEEEIFETDKILKIEKKRGSGPPPVSDEEMQRRKNTLSSLGLKSERIKQIEKLRPNLWSDERINDYLLGLKNYGFEDPSKIIARVPTILSISLENIDAKIQGLKDRGFADPVKMVTQLPSILTHSLENIDAKIQGLKDRGFADPVKMMGRHGYCFTLSLENIDAKIIGLKDRGFTDPAKTIQKAPSILGLSFENIDAKIQGLKDRGFADPIRLISTLPSIFSYSFENIDAKIQGLKDRGFKDPINLISSFASILAASFERIDHHMELFRRLVNLYQLPINIIEAMEKVAGLWSTKFDKLIVLARILRDYEVPKEEVELRMSQIGRLNLENLLIALKDKKQGETIIDLYKRTEVIKKQHLDREEKRKLIKEDLESLDLERQKIAKRYFKGYPDKEEDE